MGSDSDRMQRLLRIRCGCGSETAMLVGGPEHFVNERHVIRTAIGSSRLWREEADGRLVCERCELEIEVTRRPRPSADPED